MLLFIIIQCIGTFVDADIVDESLKLGIKISNYVFWAIYFVFLIFRNLFCKGFSNLLIAKKLSYRITR